MTYTKEEKERLLENTYEIEQWIDNYCSSLRKPFEMRFGELSEFGRMGETIKPKYEFRIVEGSSYERMGRSTVSHELDLYEKSTDDTFCRFDYDFAFALCKDWKTIKANILAHLNAENEVKDIVYKFEV